MIKPRVALMTFADEREHEYKVLYSKLVEPRHAKAVTKLTELGCEVLEAGGMARSKQSIDEQAEALRQMKPDALIAHVPCWVSPNMTCRGIEYLQLPTAVVSNDSPSTHGTVGLLGAGGALNQIGYDHIRIRQEWDAVDDTALREKLMPFLRAAAVKNRLRGDNYGLFGGRSLGIDTGVIDPMQVRKLFGIDTEHIDQSEILRLAPEISAERVSKMRNYLLDKAKSVTFDETKLTPEKLDFQIRCYFAVKDIVAAKSLDFIALKCMPDMTNSHVAQCLAATFMPSNMDPEGPKQVTPMACEADGDAAITLRFLNLLTGLPTMFADVSHIEIDTQTIYLPNCGGMCAWYATRCDELCGNLGCMDIRFANRPAGGSSQFFVAAPGPCTMARLTRYDGAYRMSIIPGEMRTPSSAELDVWIKARGIHQLPTAYIRVGIDLHDFVDKFDSNHVAVVAGDVERELRELCKLFKIPVIEYAKAE